MTQLLYLQDSNILSGAGTVMKTGEDERGAYAILDQTVFYPQGGGQPADQGDWIWDGRTVLIKFVGFMDGHVRHYIDKNELPPVGAKIDMRVNESIRRRNCRGHTTGHLVAHVMEFLYPQMIATKGYHFPDDPHVECANVEPPQGDDVIAKINDQIAKCINDNMPVQSMILSFDELQQKCPHLPSNLPPDKPLRAVQIGHFPPVPCGGTHVKHLSELGPVSVSKIKGKKGNTKISYSFE